MGVAAVFPVSRDSGFILSSASPRYEEFLDKDLDENFILYYKNFVKAYYMRPLAFDIYRRSQEKFTNNDKTIDISRV